MCKGSTHSFSSNLEEFMTSWSEQLVLRVGGLAHPWHGRPHHLPGHHGDVRGEGGGQSDCQGWRNCPATCQGHGSRCTYTGHSRTSDSPTPTQDTANAHEDCGSLQTGPIKNSLRSPSTSFRGSVQLPVITSKWSAFVVLSFKVESRARDILRSVES